VNEQVIGRCSLCGGTVVVPVAFMSTVPPQPRCRDCGAVGAEPALPVIPMKGRHSRRWLNDDGPAGAV